MYFFRSSTHLPWDPSKDEEEGCVDPETYVLGGESSDPLWRGLRDVRHGLVGPGERHAQPLDKKQNDKNKITSLH